jgi:hypothetical protein
MIFTVYPGNCLPFYFLIRFLECARNVPVQRCLVVCGVKSDFFCSLLNELFSELFSGIERRDHISWNIIAINVETEERRIKKISSWSLQIWWKLLCEEFSGS